MCCIWDCALKILTIDCILIHLYQSNYNVQGNQIYCNDLIYSFGHKNEIKFVVSNMDRYRYPVIWKLLLFTMLYTFINVWCSKTSYTFFKLQENGVDRALLWGNLRVFLPLKSHRITQGGAALHAAAEPNVITILHDTTLGIVRSKVRCIVVASKEVQN